MANDNGIKWKNFRRYCSLVMGKQVTGEFTTQRSVTRSFDVLFDVRQNKRSRYRWFESPSRSWRHCYDKEIAVSLQYTPHSSPSPTSYGVPILITLDNKPGNYVLPCTRKTCMKISWHRNAFRITGPLWWESWHWWIFILIAVEQTLVLVVISDTMTRMWCRCN